MCGVVPASAIVSGIPGRTYRHHDRGTAIYTTLSTTLLHMCVVFTLKLRFPPIYIHLIIKLVRLYLLRQRDSIACVIQHTFYVPATQNAEYIVVVPLWCRHVPAGTIQGP